MNNLNLKINAHNLNYLIKKLWQNLNYQRKFKLILTTIMMFFASFAEMASLGAVIPFLGIIASPETFYEYDIARIFLDYFQITDLSNLLPLISIMFAMTVIIAAVFRTVLLRIILNNSYSAGSELSQKAFSKIINQSFLDHLNTNSSELISIMGPKLNNAIAVINNILIFFSSTIVVIGLLSVLVFIQPIITLFLFGIFSLVYLFLSLIFKSQLKYNSDRCADLGPFLVKTLQESLGGIRNIILDGNQTYYKNIYTQTELEFRKSQANTVFISNCPRPIMEALGVIIVIILAYFFSLKHNGIQSYIPVLGFVVLGAQRMLPSFQQAFAAWSYIKGEQKSLNDLLNIIDKPIELKNRNTMKNDFDFNSTIELKKISFRFSNDDPWIIKDLELKISKGSWVGIIGETGCGKSTLIDIIMGLLNPSSGHIKIDNKFLLSTDNIKNWQSLIAHVPQVIFLSDNTISENIAFGIRYDDIDHDLVKSCAEIAQISELIMSLPEKYNTVVGERGSKLSGGQRQRIGIARALYKQAEIIIFDESTNALDNSKEMKVMQALENLPSNITVIMIAHRKSTLKKCSQIIDLSPNYLIKNQ